MLWEILLVLLVTWLIITYLNKRADFKNASHLPQFSYKWYPFVGQAYIMLGSDEDRMKGLQMAGREAILNDGLVSLWFGRRLMIVVSDPEMGEQILKTCTQKDDIMKYIQDVTGNGLIFAEKNIWRPRRKVMVPAFNPKYLIPFTEIFARQSKITVQKLEEVCGKEDFSIFKYLTKYAMDSVCESNLGINMGIQSHPNHPFLEAFDVASQVVAARVCQPWLQFDFVYRLTSKYWLMENTIKKELFGFIEKIIKQRRKDMKENAHRKPTNNTTLLNNAEKSVQKNFMEMLIENSGGDKGYTDLELREEIMVLVLAGTDTSAVGASFTLLMLAKHDDVQAKLLKELHEVFGDSDRLLTNDDFPKLKYLDAVVKESLRLYPPVPFIVRKVEKDITLPTGLSLFPGIGVFVSIWGIHRNPKFWGEDAEIFRPERFLDEKLQHPAAFMPFSYGPRNCIGQILYKHAKYAISWIYLFENGCDDNMLYVFGYNYALMSMKVVVSTIIRRYQALPALSSTNFAPHFVNGNKAKEKYAKCKFDIMMKDSSNFMLRLQKR